MKLPAWLFISFWAVISITFLHLSFRALDKAELSGSVSPLAMIFLKHYLAISSCFSSSCALIFRSKSSYVVRSNYVFLVYVFSSVVFPRTIEGILIWHVLKAIFSWLLYFLLKFEIFFKVIFRVLWKILPVISLIVLAMVLYYVDRSKILSIIVYLAKLIFLASIGALFQIIYSYATTWFLSATSFVWNPIISFLSISLGLLFSIVFLLLLCVYTEKFILFCKNNFSEMKARTGMLLLLEISLFFVNGTKTNFSPFLVFSVSHLTCFLWAELSKFVDYTPISDGKRFERLLHNGMKVVSLIVKMNKHGAKKYVEFAVGIAGAILFQCFFKTTSLNEVVFVCLAVIWQANMVLLGFSGDFGVFNFLLANVVGVTLGQFGIHSFTTLVAVGAALLLYGLRLKLETLTMAYEEGEHMQVSVWGNNQPIAQPHEVAL